jgi:phosphatidylserine decarboxylase
MFATPALPERPPRPEPPERGFRAAALRDGSNAAVRFPFATYGRFDLYVSTSICLGVAGACAWFAGDVGGWLYVPAAAAVVVWLVLVNFFRDPERTTPRGEFLVIAPADGVVKDVGDVEEPKFIGGMASRVGIFLSPLDVHVNRMPMDCTVVQVIYVKGKMLKAYDPLAITENEAASACLEVLGGRSKMIVRQVTGALARRIVCPVLPGERYEAGQRYGMIKLGSRTEVWVPKTMPVRWNVKVGDRVRAGETVLGVLEPPGGAA